MSQSLFSRLSSVRRSATHEDPEGGGDVAEQKVRAHLTSQAMWAADLVKQLVVGEASNSLDKLNPAVLNNCEGLAFINARKGGLGVTVASGYGFVIKKLNQDQHGTSVWSPPVFFTISQLGFGLSAGYQHTQTVTALLAAGAMEVFVKGTSSLGSDLMAFSTDGALTGMSGGAAMGKSQHLGMTVNQDRSAFCYSLVDGAYLEVSLHGSAVTPDHGSNQALYGPEFKAEDVLGGKMVLYNHMPEMLPLIRQINTFGRAAVQSM